MKNKWIFSVIVLIFSGVSYAQELNCNVVINHDKLAQSNTQIFKALESSVRDFMNNTKFTSYEFATNEKIDCQLIFNIVGYENNSFTTTLTVGSSRPIYNSNYNSPVFSYSEEGVVFRYIEFEPIVYSENAYTSELAALLSFYANLFIGLDGDTFAANGGTENLNKARAIMQFAQANGGSGWQQGSSTNNRYYLITDILSTQFSSYRQALYQYHINGIDLLASEPERAKKNMNNAFKLLNNNHNTRPNNLTNRLFFNAKADEIINIYSGGPEFDKKELVELLNKINPGNSMKWYRL